VTPERFLVASLLFHAVLLWVVFGLARRWRDPERCRLALPRWSRALCGEVWHLAWLAYASALLATLAANFFDLPDLRIGPVSFLLLSQALFGESILVAVLLALWHRRSGERARAGLFAAAALLLGASYWDGFHVEPHDLEVRRYVVDRSEGGAEAHTLRILHLTDIQTPTIGAHEERALREGLAFRPDLVVMTGDYVQDYLGRPTEARAAADLRALMGRVGLFDVPLGVFATEGDVGPSCRAVFAGTPVTCLTDASARVGLPWGESLAITGLSRGGGRLRDPKPLMSVVDAAPAATHHIVISHSPDFIDTLAGRGSVDLALAGHTHGGQVVIPFYGPPKTASRLPRLYAGGLHDYAGVPLHVSRGVGMERGFAPQVRFFCPPEIGILDLRLPAGPQRPASVASSFFLRSSPHL
jgi:predicted MPP superfamily phosphohydrolase